MNTHSAFIVVVTLSLFCGNSSAQYFSDDGFTLGMSKSSAFSVIRSMGLSNLEVKENFVIGNRKIDGAWLFYEFHFCQNKLVFYRKDILPSIKNLIFILNSLSSKYGKEFKTYTNISISAVGEERSLSFLWEKTLYRVEISYNIYPSNESLTIRYFVPIECIKD